MKSAERPTFYPPDLAEYLVANWDTIACDGAELPSLASLTSFLEVLYRTSFLTEENEPVRCRAILAGPDVWKMGEGPPSGFHVLPFTGSRPFSPQELRKLTPAASYYRALLGVYTPPGATPEIWGIIQSGARWVNQSDGGRFHGTPLPPNLVGHIIGPGHLLVSCGYKRLVELFGGRLLESGFDPFRAEWLHNLFRPVRQWLLEQLKENPLEGAVMSENFIKTMAQNVLRRALSLVRTRGHGGMLIFLPHRWGNPAEINRLLRLRCSFIPSSATWHFTELMLKAMERLSQVGYRQGRPSVSWTDYQTLEDPQLSELDESFYEMAHLFADLMGTDGALVLSSRFELVGFGAEVMGETPVREVYRALDMEGMATRLEEADSSGTRHRAAYRFVSAVPGSLVIVISQDRTIRFIVNKGGKVTYWPYLP
jgi:hypothetical protein